MPSTTTMSNYVCLWYFKEMLKLKDNDDKNTGYDKVKHLVGLDEDIFAVFIVE